MAAEFQSFSSVGICESRRRMHTPSPFARSCLFYVQEVGILKSIQSHLCKRDGLDSFLFVLVKSGSGRITHQGAVHTLRAGDCVLIDCSRPYSHQSSENEPWELMWIHFNGVTARSYYSYFIKNFPSGIFHTDDTTAFVSLIWELLDVAARKDRTAELISSKLITDVLTLCFTVPLQKELSDRESSAGKMLAVKEYIDAHFAEKLTLDELSERFFLSKFHLSREFKRVCGVTVGSYILTQRVNYAKELLRFSDKSIEAVAAGCGIADSSYFNKVFKKSEGISPSRYRQLWARRS